MTSILQQHDNSVFWNEHDDIIPHKSEEREEQLDAYVFLPSDSTVLELGGRYGTVSCLINRILTHKKNHVVVEPDALVIPALTKNRNFQDCQFEIFNGAVSKVPVSFKQSGYSSFTSPVGHNEGGVTTRTLSELEEQYNLKFDVLVADCEGCICQFMEENNMNQFKLILLEKDQPCLCDYGVFEATLTKLGFVCIRNKLNIVYRSVYINTNKLPFKVLYNTTSHGDIGLFGKLGFAADNTTDIAVDDWETMSLHAPSTVLIKNKVPLKLAGYCSPTAQSPPVMTFKCDETVIGATVNAKGMTGSIVIEPGKHILNITTTSRSFAHSVWLFKEF